MAPEANLTVIGPSAIFRGEISGECDVQINGTLEGRVDVPSSRITVGPDAKVHAALSAQHIVVHGFVEGELRSSERTELRSTATVLGNVYAPRLAVEDEATLRGQVDVSKTVDASASSKETPRTPQSAEPAATSSPAASAASEPGQNGTQGSSEPTAGAVPAGAAPGRAGLVAASRAASAEAPKPRNS